MIDLFNLQPIATLPIYFLGGLLLGLVYFSALRRTTRLIVQQGHPLLALGLSIGRLAILGVGLYLAVLAGGFALLVTLAGVICARALTLRKVGRTGL